jgi:hypothetical protein
MPYSLQKSGRGYYVVNTQTGHRFSSKPLPKSRASAQMRLLYAVERGYPLRSKKMRKSKSKRRSKARK